MPMYGRVSCPATYIVDGHWVGCRCDCGHLSYRLRVHGRLALLSERCGPRVTQVVGGVGSVLVLLESRHDVGDRRSMFYLDGPWCMCCVLVHGPDLSCAGVEGPKGPRWAIPGS